MKPWIVWMCFGLLYLGVQEAEARRITGGKPMAPRSPGINYEQLQQHRTQSRAGYQSGYYDQAYQAEVRRGRSVNSMVESNTGSPPVYPLNYGSLRRSVLEDDDFVPPDLDVINLACDAAMQLRDMGAIPPTMVAPDGEGGTSFEYVEGKSSVSLNIYADLTVECLTFDDCRLIRREPVVS